MNQESDENESSEDEDIGMEIDELSGVNVNMELKGLSIEEEDYTGIRQLLIPLLPKSNMNLSELTDNIIGQNFIGHIIKQVDENTQEAADEDPVLSISTIIPLKDQKWVSDMRDFLEKKCQSESGNVVALRSFFDGKNNAWFIN